MPGIEVTDDGTIEVEGKEVSKITVEGKDFFDGDSKLATQNLPANAVNKVEVLRNFTEVNQLRSVTNNEDNIAINISLKSGKDKLTMKMSIRTNKSGHPGVKKLGQFSLAVKYNGLA